MRATLFILFISTLAFATDNKDRRAQLDISIRDNIRTMLKTQDPLSLERLQQELSHLLADRWRLEVLDIIFEETKEDRPS